MKRKWNTKIIKRWVIFDFINEHRLICISLFRNVFAFLNRIFVELKKKFVGVFAVSSCFLLNRERERDIWEIESKIKIKYFQLVFLVNLSIIRNQSILNLFFFFFLLTFLIDTFLTRSDLSLFFILFYFFLLLLFCSKSRYNCSRALFANDKLI